MPPSSKRSCPRNVVSGHLAIGVADRLTEVDADLKADQLSLPPILGYPLALPPSDRMTLALSNVIPAQSQDIWSDRPFVLNVFQDTAAKVMLSAKTMKLAIRLRSRARSCRPRSMMAALRCRSSKEKRLAAISRPR